MALITAIVAAAAMFLPARARHTAVAAALPAE